MRKNYAEFPEVKAGLMGFVKLELELGVTQLNSHNNKKLTKDPRYAKYESSNSKNQL